MDILLLIISLALPLAGGLFLVRWLLGDAGSRGWAEAFFLGMAAGPGLLSYWMFFIGLPGIPFNRLTVGLPLVFLTLLFALLQWRAVRASKARAGRYWPGLKGPGLYLFIAMGLWVALKTAFVYYECLTRPIFTVDSYLNWAVSAKFFYYNAGLVLDPSNEHFFGRGYRFFMGHPLHLPLFQTWIAIALGRFHEVYVKAPAALYFTGVLGVLYCTVRREAGPLLAMATVFFMATVPIFTAHGQDAYADLPLAFFALCFVVMLWRFISEENLHALILAGILGAMAGFVKNEGLFFPLSGGMALLVFLLSRKKKVPGAQVLLPLTAFVLPLVLLLGPWLLFKMHYGIGFGHSGATSRLDWLSDPFYTKAARGIHWEIIGKGLYVIFFTANYNLIFPLFLFLGVLGRKTILRTELKYIYMVILLVISMFTFVYLTLEVAAVTEQTGIHRNTLTYLPIVFLATSLTIARLWPRAPGTGPLTPGPPGGIL